MGGQGSSQPSSTTIRHTIASRRVRQCGGEVMEEGEEAPRQNCPGRPSQLGSRRTPTHGVAIQALHHRLHRAFALLSRDSVASIRRVLVGDPRRTQTVPLVKNKRPILRVVVLTSARQAPRESP